MSAQQMIEATESKVTEVKPFVFHSLLDPEQVMRILNIEENHFRKLVFRKEITVTKIGGAIRVEPQELQDYIARRKAKTKA